jgi:HAD superfamily hydrolase (TIGR01509 family)
MKITNTPPSILKTIALDIGNVCLKIQPERCFESLKINSPCKLPPELLEAIVKMETGLTGEAEWLTIFQAVTNNKFSDNELRKAYTNILGEEISGMADFLKKAVSKNIRIIFFSDTSPIHLNHIYRNLSFANLISGGVFSFDTGQLKPNPEMYEKYEQQYGKPILYIDDKPENINAGKKTGWNAHLFDYHHDHKNLYSLIEQINIPQAK